MNVLRSAFALGEVGLALSPWAPAPRPCWVDEIDADWLTSVLAAKAPAARILSIDDRGGTSGTTDRRSLGVTWTLDAAWKPASTSITASPEERTAGPL
jgi:hypothetical protein